MASKIRKAVFPVGGLGTRFLPATKAMPKEMLPVVDKPLIQYAVEEALDAGIEEIIFITGKGKSAIEDHFDAAHELVTILETRGAGWMLKGVKDVIPANVRIIYTRQGDPLGLGHAVACAKSIIGNEPFAVVLADDIFMGEKSCLSQVIDQYQGGKENIVSLMPIPKEQSSRYGIIQPQNGTDDRRIEIAGMVEKPSPEKAPSNLAISGRYILQPEIFDYLASVDKDGKGEYQLTDAIAALIGKQGVFGVKVDGERFDCGDKFGWLRANLAFALKRDDLEGDVKQMMTDLLQENQ